MIKKKAAKRKKSIVTLRDNGGESAIRQCDDDRKVVRHNDELPRGVVSPLAFRKVTMDFCEGALRKISYFYLQESLLHNRPVKFAQPGGQKKRVRFSISENLVVQVAKRKS